MPQPKSRRFKVQRRVELKARDRSNKPFLLGVIWRSVNEVDRVATAETLLLKHQHDDPRTEYRIAEEWPLGTMPRPIFRTKTRAITRS